MNIGKHIAFCMVFCLMSALLCHAAGPTWKTLRRGTSPKSGFTVIIKKPTGYIGTSPHGTWKTTPCYHFDFQCVTSSSPGSYPLTIEGDTIPFGPYPAGLTMKWALETGLGSLANDTQYNPSHTPPATVTGECVSGSLKLKQFKNGTYTGNYDDRTVYVFRDHLARDRNNFGSGISCAGAWTFTRYGINVTMNGTWNCHGSTNHMYNGSGSGSSSDLSADVKALAKNSFNAPINWSEVYQKLQQGDIIAYYAGTEIQHTATCIDSNTHTVYGANNQAVAGPETWKWSECLPESWWNSSGTNNPPYPDCDQIIIFNR